MRNKEDEYQQAMFGKPKPQYNLFIGRFQPFHDGHKAIIQRLLDEQKRACVAIRNTARDNDNPYTVAQRRAMIRAEFPDANLVKIITIPDIEAVVYGRGVGYDIREMEMGAELEAISATEIRSQS